LSTRDRQAAHISRLAAQDRRVQSHVAPNRGIRVRLARENGAKWNLPARNFSVPPPDARVLSELLFETQQAL
jgi:hypothetical protein